MEILDRWLDDLPQQFQGKEYIESLIRAFAKQLDEIQEVYRRIELQTDLDTAMGKNLDMIGDILVLSRKDAHIILRKAKETEITDETYRSVLRYMTIKNNCECTYKDIMESLRLIWNETDISYVEKAERPATIFIIMRNADIDGIDPALGRVLAIKPAGVFMIYAIGYFFDVNILEKLSFIKLKNKVNLCKIYERIVMGLVFPYEISIIVESINVPMLISSFIMNISDKFVYPLVSAILDFQINEKSKTEKTDILCTVSIMEEIEECIKSNFNMEVLEEWLFSIVEVATDIFISEITSTERISFQYSNHIEENVEFVITINKDEWYLDGTYDLDGTKLLDSALITEVL